MSADGRVFGSYVHGLLSSTDLRAALLAKIGLNSDGTDHARGVDRALDDIAAELEQDIAVDAIIALAQQEDMR